MSDLTPEKLDELARQGQMLALVVSPTLLAEVIGKPLDPAVTVESAYTFGDTVYDGVQDRDLLVVSLSMRRDSKVKGVVNALRGPGR